MFKTDAVLHTIDKVYFYNRQGSAYNRKSKCLLTDRVARATDKVNVYKTLSSLYNQQRSAYNWQSKCLQPTE